MRVIKLLEKIEKLVKKSGKRIFVEVKKLDTVYYDGILSNCICLFEYVDFYRFSYDSVTDDCKLEIELQ